MVTGREKQTLRLCSRWTWATPIPSSAFTRAERSCALAPDDPTGGDLRRDFPVRCGLVGDRADRPRLDVIVASVVPSLNFPMKQAFRQLYGSEPLFVEPGVKTGMPILYEVPQEVGADRIVNAVAAHARLGGRALSSTSELRPPSTW